MLKDIKSNRCEENRSGNESFVKEIFIPIDKPIVIEKGIGETLFKKIQQHGDKIAQIDALTGRKETYAEIFSKSVRVAQNLRLKGISSKDVISICTYNHLDYAPLVYASFFVGSFTAPLDPTSSLSDHVHNLKIVQPKIIFCDQEIENIMKQALKEAKLNINIVVFGKTDHNIDFNDFLIQHEPEESFKVIQIKDVFDTACIHYSSGTTGLPKAVCVTHYALLSENSLIKGTTVGTSIAMVVTNSYWISNMKNFIRMSITGNTRVLVKQFDEKTCLKYVQDYKVNVIFLNSVHGYKLIQNPDHFKYDISSLKKLTTGGTATPKQQFLDYIKAFPNVVIEEAYGMTETGGVVFKPCPKTKELLDSKLIPIGTPFPGYKYKIIDPETGKICGPTEPGELLIKCPTIFNNYYNNPEAYKESFDEDGFFKTGDIFYYENEYVFTYVNRLKDNFKYKGCHISPLIIEEQLIKHPNIKQAVVVGVPETAEGENITAAVIVHNKDKFNVEDVKGFIKDNLSDRYHIRGDVFLIDSIPLTSTGKVQRKKVLEFVLQKKKNCL